MVLWLLDNQDDKETLFQGRMKGAEHPQDFQDEQQEQECAKEITRKLKEERR